MKLISSSLDFHKFQYWFLYILVNLNISCAFMIFVLIYYLSNTFLIYYFSKTFTKYCDIKKKKTNPFWLETQFSLLPRPAQWWHILYLLVLLFCSLLFCNFWLLHKTFSSSSICFWKWNFRLVVCLNAPCNPTFCPFL